MNVIKRIMNVILKKYLEINGIANQKPEEK